MSVLLNFAIFPTDKGDSVSPYVSRVIQKLRSMGFPNQLTAMGTIVETDSLSQALSVINEAYSVLENDCQRVYITANFDIRKGSSSRMARKVKSVEEKIGKTK
jgi:uncharacterized protein (TIGR00106 family)